MERPDKRPDRVQGIGGKIRGQGGYQSKAVERVTVDMETISGGVIDHSIDYSRQFCRLDAGGAHWGLKGDIRLSRDYP